jgi:hypothetical protein
VQELKRAHRDAVSAVISIANRGSLEVWSSSWDRTCNIWTNRAISSSSDLVPVLSRIYLPDKTYASMKLTPSTTTDEVCKYVRTKYAWADNKVVQLVICFREGALTLAFCLVA